MFAEGVTTNGTELMKFRKGAFYGERRVTPIILKYQGKLFSTAYDVMNYLPLLFMNMCVCCLRCDVKVMPDFEPNEYLFKTHKDKGAERWEIFAWAVRDAMAKAGDFKLSDLKISEKVHYWGYLNGYVGYSDPALDPQIM